MKKIAVLVAILGLALVKPAHAATFNEIVYSSSHTATADTSVSLAPGRAFLYKVLISSAGAGGTPLVTVLSNGTTVAQIDGTTKSAYTYEAVISGPLQYTTAGTTPPQVTLLYRQNVPNFGTTGLSPYSIYNSTGVYTTKLVHSGRAYLKRILVTKAGTPPSAVTVYDSQGAVGKILDVMNAEAVSANDYNVFASSGITFTSTGSPNVTFVYGVR